MKNLIILCCMIIFSSYSLYSQSDSVWIESDTGSIHGQIDYYLAPLDKSFVTSGILMEKTLCFVNTHLFTGNIIPDSIVTMQQWRQLCFQMRKGSVLQYSPIPPIDTVITRAQEFVTQNTIPIMILHTKYDRLFKDSAIADSLIYESNGQLHDVANRPSNPFQMYRLFAATPFLSKTEGLSVNFRIDSSLYIKNFTDNIIAMEIDFGKSYL